MAESRLLYVAGGLLSTPVLKDFRDTKRYDDGKTLFFVDPPYLGTQGNYIDKTAGIDRTSSISAADIEDFVLGLKSPVLMTYGDGAQETFANLDWKLATKRKVPLIRTGGTRERSEWYCSLHSGNHEKHGAAE